MEIESRLPTSRPGLNPDTQSPSGERRKSGRATRKPELFSQTLGDGNGEATGGPKRKRTTGGDENDDEAEDAEDMSEPESEDVDEEDEPDEEELREQRRAARNAAAKKASSGIRPKPKSQGARSAKKPKVTGNGIANQLALRPAANGGKPASRPRKPKVRPSLIAGESGLYAEVFGKSRNAEIVAADWLTRYQQGQTTAMRDLINLVFRSSGTDLKVTTDDIEDVDHVVDRVQDFQNQYHAQGISEYPLISKSRKFKSFQPVLENFFMALMQTLHHSSVLYDDRVLYENLQSWLSSMSSSSCRPFRHTATVAALSNMNALCDIAREVMTSVSTSRKQLESEKRKKTVNKGRADAINLSIKEGENKLEVIDDLLKDGVNVIFVNRYRDVDPRIRAESIAALGRWMHSYREYFFEGQFLRYCGWIMSDSDVHTRSIALRQLLSLYTNKDNIAGLRSFTERFRQRFVEIAAHDADVGVRTMAIELLDLIRDAGLIEPADVDTVGRLIFDLEARVRKAAGPFFVANVQDVFDSTIEEVAEEVNEMFGDEDEDDFESPKRAWIKFKCLADILQAYDTPEGEPTHEPSVKSRDALPGIPMDSRFVLATEAIYPHLDELTTWQSLAGYLLFDHSQIPDDGDGDTTGEVKKLYKMQEGQEVILLEVLCCAVKLRILDVAKSDIDKRGRKVKALTDRIPELQEEIAHSLAQIIPQLLNKFGSTPEAASAVLRLEHLVDLDKIQDLQKDATAYTSLLNDINKQFLSHSNQDVLAEASVAFLHAKSSDDMREALESKVQELWDDMVDTLNKLSQQKEVASHNPIPPSVLNELNNTITRISNLSGVTDCTLFLETPVMSRSKGRSKKEPEAPFNIVLRLVQRGFRRELPAESDEDEDTSHAETEVVLNSIRTLLFYFMWKVQNLRAALAAGKAKFNTAYFEALTKSRESFVEALVAIMKEHSGLDDVRFSATTTLLDLQTLFGTFRNSGLGASNDEDTVFQAQSLVHEFDTDVQELITKIHGITLRTYAKKSRVPFEPGEDDAPASDSDLEREPVDDEEEDSDQILQDERLRSKILAEQRLCELTGKIVLAIVGRILDSSGSKSGQLKKKLLKHKTQLGPNYREVLVFLEDRAPKRPASRTAPSKGKPSAAQGTNKGQPRAGSGKRPEQSKSDERVDEEEEDDERISDEELVDPVDLDKDNDEEAENRAAALEPDEDDIMDD
ncbi:cohesin subunit IRR1 [Aspergillus lucknowensis]|uniref:SCD domain-containing protein n=1 Tax=Aspergillus lucknowensis TaxID=176173 RepID=A0ABR4LEF7_9EURO